MSYKLKIEFHFISVQNITSFKFKLYKVNNIIIYLFISLNSEIYIRFRTLTVLLGGPRFPTYERFDTPYENKRQ